MRRLPLHVLRIGLGITFAWIGVLVWRDPASWAGLIHPSIARFIPQDPATFMRETGALDIALGVCLMLGFWTWLFAALAALHLLGVIIAIPFGDTTARDTGLLFGSVALFLETMPEKWRQIWWS